MAGGDAWRARLGMVLQSWRDHSRWRVRDLVRHLAGFYEPWSTPQHPRPWDTDALLDRVGLGDKAQSRIGDLSGGQRRRLDVAVGLVGRPELMWITAFVVYASMAVSGIFYPITALPDWLAALGKCLPAHWIGLGYRSALLPPEAAALEAGGSWQTGLTALVLTGWALVGLSVAPRALLRLARRQSGSQVAAARDRIMSRGY
ncbi:MAG: hypothetical protein LCH82_15565 [Actinobacteria bacterium]|nr:hypothetical protein [Actinomycetota bacterium]